MELLESIQYDESFTRNKFADCSARVGGSTGPRPQRDGGESRADDKFAGCSTDALCTAIGRTRSHTQQIKTPCDKAGETTGSTTKG